MRIAVVGAGWAGLAAAVELTRLGLPVTLFEAGRVPGGRARTVKLAGRELDNGQHLLLGAYRDTLALMRLVGADPEQLLDRRPLTVVDNCGFRLALPRWPAPLNLAWGLLSARGVSLGEKLKTAWWMDQLKRAGFQVDEALTVSAWLDAAGQTGACAATCGNRSAWRRSTRPPTPPRPSCLPTCCATAWAARGVKTPICSCHASPWVKFFPNRQCAG
jgi:hydroxysqualene dehydroxylase